MMSESEDEELEAEFDCCCCVFVEGFDLAINKTSTRSDFSIPWKSLSDAPRASISALISATFIEVGSAVEDEDILKLVVNNNEEEKRFKGEDDD